MRKKYFIIFIFIFSFVKVDAQVFHGGIKGGLLGSQISGDMLSGFNKLGVHGGLYTGFNINNDFQLQIEMLFIQKGSRQNPNHDKGIYSMYLLRLNYIELPLLLIWKGNASKFDIEGGFSFGYLINNENIEWNENGILPGTMPFNRHEISIQLGMSYEVNNDFKAFFRFTNSLLPVRKHKGGATYLLNFGQYNTSIMLGLIYELAKRNNE